MLSSHTHTGTSCTEGKVNCKNNLKPNKNHVLQQHIQIRRVSTRDLSRLSVLLALDIYARLKSPRYPEGPAQLCSVIFTTALILSEALYKQILRISHPFSPEVRCPECIFMCTSSNSVVTTISPEKPSQTWELR